MRKARLKMVVNAIPLTPNTFCDVTGPFAVCFLRQLARGLSFMHT